MCASFVRQTLHEGARSAAGSANSGIKNNYPLLSRQGDWDGACGLHCAAMALKLLNRLNNHRQLPARSAGTGASFWKHAAPFYFDGVSGQDLAKLIKAFDPSLQVRRSSGAHSTIRCSALRHLKKSKLAIVGWSSRNGLVHHWVLAIGLEGLVTARGYKNDAILCLDPSGSEPSMCAYNARLERDTTYDEYLLYRVGSKKAQLVALTEIVVIGEA